MSKYIDALMGKLGYTSTAKCLENEARLQRLRKNTAAEYHRINNMHVDEIVRAIQMARMVRVKYEEDRITYVSKDFEEPSAIPLNHWEQPPPPEWYAITTQIDAAVIRRARDDLMANRRPAEVEYMLDALMHKLKKNLMVVMGLSR